MGRVGAAELGTQQRTTKDGRETRRVLIIPLFTRTIIIIPNHVLTITITIFALPLGELTAAKPRGGPRSALWAAHGGGGASHATDLTNELPPVPATCDMAHVGNRHAG